MIPHACWLAPISYWGRTYTTAAVTLKPLFAIRGRDVDDVNIRLGAAAVGNTLLWGARALSMQPIRTGQLQRMLRFVSIPIPDYMFTVTVVYT